MTFSNSQTGLTEKESFVSANSQTAENSASANSQNTANANLANQNATEKSFFQKVGDVASGIFGGAVAQAGFTTNQSRTQGAASATFGALGGALAGLFTTADKDIDVQTQTANTAALTGLATATIAEKQNRQLHQDEVAWLEANEGKLKAQLEATTNKTYTTSEIRTLLIKSAKALVDRDSALQTEELFDVETFNVNGFTKDEFALAKELILANSQGLKFNDCSLSVLPCLPSSIHSNQQLFTATDEQFKDRTYDPNTPQSQALQDATLDIILPFVGKNTKVVSITENVVSKTANVGTKGTFVEKGVANLDDVAAADMAAGALRLGAANLDDATGGALRLGATNLDDAARLGGATRITNAAGAGVGGANSFGASTNLASDFEVALKSKAGTFDEAFGGSSVTGSTGNAAINNANLAVKFADDGVSGYSMGLYTPVEYTGSVKVGGEIRDVSRRVYQRSDIDINYFDTTTGMTNLERMYAGKPPIGSDGNPIQLHHILQKEAGPMVEIEEIMHQKYYLQLHGLIEDGASFRNNPVLNKQYNNFRRYYWKWRAGQIIGD